MPVQQLGEYGAEGFLAFMIFFLVNLPWTRAMQTREGIEAKGAELRQSCAEAEREGREDFEVVELLPWSCERETRRHAVSSNWDLQVAHDEV